MPVGALLPGPETGEARMRIPSYLRALPKGAMLTLAVAQLLFALLTIYFLSSFASKTAFEMASLEFNQEALKLTMAMRIGRTPDKFPALEDDVQRLEARASSIFVCDAQGERCAVGKAPADPSRTASGALEAGGKAYASRPFYDTRGKVAGYIGDLPSKPAAGSFQDLSFMILLSALIAAAFGALLLALPASWARGAKWRVASLLLSQCLGAALVAPQAYDAFEARITSLEAGVGYGLVRELSRLARMGVDVGGIAGLDSAISEIRGNAGLPCSLSITLSGGTVLASSGAMDRGGTLLDVTGPRRQPVAQVRSSLDMEAVRHLLLSYIFDTLALASVAVITALRSDAFASGLLLGRARLGARSPLGIGAAMGFFAVAGMYMPLCIVPLFMRELARGQSLLSPEIMMSLPVSADMAAVLAASLLMLLRPALASRWEALLPLGIMLACAAMAGCALAPSAPAFIASRLCYGLGYGFFIIGMQVFAVSASKAGSSGQGLGAVFSSLFAGTVCGCVTGGIAADIMGYRAVFAISCAVLLLPLACALRMRQAFGEKKDEAPACAQPRRGGALRILRDPGFLRLMIFNVLPYGAAVTGIFNFFVPVLINRGGYGSSVVGELTLIYALTVSLLSPLAGRLIDRVRNKSRALSLGGLFAALALSSLIIPSPLAAAAASLLFLGLCAALCESGQPAAVTAGSAGDPAQTLVLLDVFIRIGQFAGPLAISLLVTAGGATHAFAALALLEIACAALLLLSSRQAR